MAEKTVPEIPLEMSIDLLPPPMSFPMGFRASIKLFYQESTVHEPLLCHFATKPEQILMHFQSAKNKN